MTNKTLDRLAPLKSSLENVCSSSKFVMLRTGFIISDTRFVIYYSDVVVAWEYNVRHTTKQLVLPGFPPHQVACVTTVITLKGGWCSTAGFRPPPY